MQVILSICAALLETTTLDSSSSSSTSSSSYWVVVFPHNLNIVHVGVLSSNSC